MKEFKYTDPVSKKERVIKLVDINLIEPSPLQREISEKHVENLAKSIAKLGFLDPLIGYEANGKYWIVNGQHRLMALRHLGAQGQIPVLIIGVEDAKYILDMNIEKAPNIKDKSIEALKVYKEFIKTVPHETEFVVAESVGEICLVTFGLCYAMDNRFPASSFFNLIKKIDLPENIPLSDGLELRQQRANKLMELKEIFNQKKQEFIEAGYDKMQVGNIIISLANPWGRKRIIEESFDDGIEMIMERMKSLTP
jgi:ParB family chromosome partitioning protein